MNLITSDDETTHTVLIRSHLKNAEESDTESLKMHSSYFRMLQGVSARELGWRWLRQCGPFCCVCDLSRAAVRRSMFTADPDTSGLALGGKCRDIPPPTSSVCGRCQLQVEFAAKPQIPQEMLTDEGKGLKHSRLPGLDKSCSGGSTGL